MGAPLATTLRALLASATVAALTAAAVLIAAHLTMPVAGIDVEGARMFPESEAWNAVPDRASLLTLNTDALEKRIESNPWVEGAEVSKEWESGIVAVQVEERRAILDGEVDGRRLVVAADGEELPGTGGARLERVELGRDQLRDVVGASAMFGEAGMRLDSVDSVGPEGIRATVEGRKVIFAEEVGEAQASALEGLMRRHPDARLFDLRSPERVVVATGDSVQDAGAEGVGSAG